MDVTQELTEEVSLWARVPRTNPDQVPIQEADATKGDEMRNREEEDVD
jgi:hypothetical protein